MKTTTIQIDAIEQLVILNALKHANKTGFFKTAENVGKGKVSLFAWQKLADRLTDRLERELNVEAAPCKS